MDASGDPRCARESREVTCTAVSAQYADVSLPVQVKPYAVVEQVETVCCGDPVVAVRRASDCGCTGCEITITQSVCVRLSVKYGTDAEAGDVMVSCRQTPAGGCARGR